MANRKEHPTLSVSSRTSSSSSTTPSLSVPRTPRFAEATAVNSPIGPSKASKSPFDDPSEEARPSDVGFGYIADTEDAKHANFPTIAVEEVGSRGPPLKSALKSPGAPPRRIDTSMTENPLSPTFREEQILDKTEKRTDKENAKDLRMKFRVRIAKVFLRGINFSCSLIVLSMLSSTFAIFNATKAIPKRNNLPPWAENQKIWPQVLLLCIAAVSLFLSICIFYAYYKGGHRRAEKSAKYYTYFSLAFFLSSIIVWAIGAGILHQTRQHSGQKDMWGWACNSNQRKKLFEGQVHYDLVCRIQNWSFVCAFIEIVVEMCAMAVYGAGLYRFYTKNRLRKSMNVREKARGDLYLAQLRTQTAPNTPGFKSPMASTFPPSYADPHSVAERGEGSAVQYAEEQPQGFPAEKPFQLQAPPIRIQNATPKPAQAEFGSSSELRHYDEAAPGETQYEAVPIPGAYTGAAASHSYDPTMQQDGTYPPAFYGQDVKEHQQ
ncbi:MAG: hypothetical protein M1819_004370 [Sarea resinae]|nr:MAG: hypothetical protein M1819_004370 [Sarea resinae]